MTIKCLRWPHYNANWWQHHGHKMMMLNDGFLPSSDDQMRHTGNKMMQAYIWHVCQWWPVIPRNNQMMPNFTYDVQMMPHILVGWNNIYKIQPLKLSMSHLPITQIVDITQPDDHITLIDDFFSPQWWTNSAHWRPKSRMSLYLSVNDKLSLMTSSMKWAPEALYFILSVMKVDDITQTDDHMMIIDDFSAQWWANNAHWWPSCVYRWPVCQLMTSDAWWWPNDAKFHDVQNDDAFCSSRVK